MKSLCSNFVARQLQGRRHATTLTLYVPFRNWFFLLLTLPGQLVQPHASQVDRLFPILFRSPSGTRAFCIKEQLCSAWSTVKDVWEPCCSLEALYKIRYCSSSVGPRTRKVQTHMAPALRRVGWARASISNMHCCFGLCSEIMPCLLDVQNSLCFSLNAHLVAQSSPVA